MPRPRESEKRAIDPWTDLTWSDLTDWAGSRSVERGRSYQRNGRVKKLEIAEDGTLLASVTGTMVYATSVSSGDEKRSTGLASSCSCPVGSACKHAVAVIAEYLEMIADGRSVPTADPDDPRWEQIEEGYDFEDGGGDEYDEWSPPRRGSKRGKSSAGGGPAGKNAIEKFLLGKSNEELVELVMDLAGRYPEVGRQFREQIALAGTDVKPLVKAARGEIRRITAQPAWQNHWDDQGELPDYAPIKARLERLMELACYDEVVELGRDLIDRGFEQVDQSHDEGETAGELGSCLGTVFRAVALSDLPAPDQIIFAIDTCLRDDYGIIGDEADPVLQADHRPEDWSRVAEILAGRIAEIPANPNRDAFSSDYSRKALTGWMSTALENAGREDELGKVYEAEARATKDARRMVAYLIEHRQYDDAERWAALGIAETAETFPGIARDLAQSIRELAVRRKRWDVAASHAALGFFSDYPSPDALEELLLAAKRADVEESVRTAAMHYLETDVPPYRTIARKAPARATKASRSSRAKGREVQSSPAEPYANPKLKVDPSWPLPVPDAFLPIVEQTGRARVRNGPHYDVLLRIAISEKRTDQVLYWYDRIVAERDRGNLGIGSVSAVEVAEAVAESHPERAIEIYRDRLDAQLPHANDSSYYAAVDALKRLRPLHEARGNLGEWEELVASIREDYRRRPKFIALLDDLDGGTILDRKLAGRR